MALMNCASGRQHRLPFHWLIELASHLAWAGHNWTRNDSNALTAYAMDRADSCAST